MSKRPLRSQSYRETVSHRAFTPSAGPSALKHPPRRGAKDIREGNEGVPRVLSDIRLVLDALEEVLGCSLVFSLCFRASRSIVVVILALAVILPVHCRIPVLALLLDALALALLLCSSAVGLCSFLLGRLLPAFCGPDGSRDVEADLDTLVWRGPAEPA